MSGMTGMEKLAERRMRAVEFDGYGGSEVLKIRARPIPEPGPGEVLVRVHAAGLNPKDTMIRSGSLRLQTGRTFPRGTGFDLAGRVVAVGSGVEDLPEGTRAFGFLDGVLGGTAADHVLVPRACLAPMPDRLGWGEAAVLPLVASAALQALRGVASLREGERVLIRGASGGVGSAAIQIARAMGAHVTAITSAGGLDHCRGLGAQELVDYRTTDPTSLPGLYDVFLDCVGRSQLRGYARLLGRRGRWVAVAPSPSIYALAPLSSILSPVLRLPRLGYVVVRPVAADLEAVADLVALGKLRMPISAAYPLERIREAHDHAGAGHARGKRVLLVSPEAALEMEDHAPALDGRGGAA